MNRTRRALFVDRTILLLPAAALFASPLIVTGVQSVTETHRANAAVRRACVAAVELRYQEDAVLRKTRGPAWADPCVELAHLRPVTIRAAHEEGSR